MFDFDNWAEIFSSMGKNKMRMFLTGFSISWGIFMFCILFSAGNGLKNGITSNFGDRSVNRSSFWGRTTSLPYKGLPDKRRIKLDDNDLNLVKKIPGITGVSGRVYKSATASYKTFSSSSSFLGVNPDYQQIYNIKMEKGRFINAPDIAGYRKTAVINRRMQEVLFQGEEPLGKQILVGNLGYTVIGVYRESESSETGSDPMAYIPFSTAQRLYGGGWGIDEITFTVTDVDSKEKNEVFEKNLRRRESILHTFDPKDERALGISGVIDTYLQTLGIFNGISAFIWIIGLGTLIAGVISVSNIMLITVRERTREFGIRKALGAKPRAILGSILMESIFITGVFGYFGMFLGIGFSELVNSILTGMDNDISFAFRNPTMDVSLAVGAMIILIISGVVAGYYPALKAVRIPPVEAMKLEN
ncbi:MAG: ABC transporter permease [Dysgonamonadaceae bacterium]|jgi:putative ABC transport system permease protein|nr:ABC transporter permease [Dysgonamonadaceae bacterium]